MRTALEGALKQYVCALGFNRAVLMKARTASQDYAFHAYDQNSTHLIGDIRTVCSPFKWSSPLNASRQPRNPLDELSRLSVGGGSDYQTFKMAILTVILGS